MRFANDEKHPRVLTREALKAQGGNPLPAEITRQAARDAQAAEAPPHVPVKQPSRAEVRERRSRALPDPEAEPSPHARVAAREAKVAADRAALAELTDLGAKEPDTDTDDDTDPAPIG